MRTIDHIVVILLTVLLCQPAGFARVAAANVPDAASCLAPKSFTKKEPSKKPLRVDLTTEEIEIYKLFELLEEINLRIYSSLLSRTYNKKQIAALEKRISAGEKGLEQQKGEYEKGVQKYSKRIDDDIALLKKARDEFPKPDDKESEMRKSARICLDRAIEFMEQNRIPAGEMVLASAKVKVLKDFTDMVSKHLGSVPRQLARDIMSRDRFGQHIATLTMEGFGIKVLPEGNVLAPQRFYEKDKATNFVTLKWKDANLADLPAALRQKVHIQESEENEYIAVLGLIRMIEDIKKQARDAVETEQQLTDQQCDTMTRLLLLLILRTSPKGFQKMISEQADEIESQMKRILSTSGVRGEKREAVLRKGIAEFRRAQEEIATSEEYTLDYEKRSGKIKELREEWVKAMRTELDGIGVPNEQAAAIEKELAEAVNLSMVTDTAALIVRLDPYGLIKDPHKRNALLILRQAMELIAVGRIDRNVPDMLDSAQASLFLRMENAKSIREAVERQEAALRAELLARAARDEKILKAVDSIATKVRGDKVYVRKDETGALPEAAELHNSCFTVRLDDDRMTAVADLLKELIDLFKNKLWRYQDDIGRIAKAAMAARDAIPSFEEKVREAQAELGDLKAQAPPPAQRVWTETGKKLAEARARLNALKVDAQSKADKKVPGDMQNFMAALPDFPATMPAKNSVVLAITAKIKGVLIRLDTFLKDDIAQIKAPGLAANAKREVDAAVALLKETLAKLEEYTESGAKMQEHEKKLAAAEKDIADRQKDLADAKDNEKALWKKLDEAKKIYNDFAEANVYPLLENIKKIVQDDQTPRIPAPVTGPHAFFDSTRLRLVKERLSESGAPAEKIEELLLLLEELRGLARYEGGAIHTDAFLLKLDAEISSLAGLPEKSFYMVAREILYHELVHDYLSEGEGREMVLERVLTYPGYGELKQLLAGSYLGGALDALPEELYAQEAVAKLASLLFEGEGSTSVMSAGLRAALGRLKAYLQKEAAFKVLTADGVEARGEQSAQKKVFYMLKALMGKQFERLTNKSSQELETEAQARLAALKDETESIIEDITAAIYSATPAATAQRDINSAVLSAQEVDVSK